MEKLQSIEYLIIHHSNRNFDSPFLIEIRHRFLRGWDSVGYHYFIGNGVLTKKGKVYEGQSEEYEGYHVFGKNHNSLGVCLIGNFDFNSPSKEQMEGLKKLLKEKMQKYNIDPDKIQVHREFGKTDKSCPGKMVNLDELREELRL